MSSFRFLHTSDLHLGKRFGRFEEETRMVLQQARQHILARLAALARDHGVGHVLIAGDMFDTETPSERVQRQALAEMGAAENLNWWIIPGNHDSAAAEPLWNALQKHAPENVHLLLQPDPVPMAPGVVLLPAPCRHRFSGQDLTAWMGEAETEPGVLRIAIAHGGVLEFGSDATTEGGETISPRRAEQARLDYMALGDWHGQFRVNDRMHYSGSPEADRFKHEGRGHCLLVEIPAPGEVPQVVPLETGQCSWQEIRLPLSPSGDVAAAVRDSLPEHRAGWRHHLIRVCATGWVTAPQRLALQREVSGLAPEFCHLELDLTDLGTEHHLEDLDLIGRGGALRVAAEELMRAAEDPALAATDRQVAAAALNRLFGYTQDEDEPGENP